MASTLNHFKLFDREVMNIKYLSNTWCINTVESLISGQADSGHLSVGGDIILYGHRKLYAALKKNNNNFDLILVSFC